MTNLLIFIFGVVGITHIVVDSTIFEPFRTAVKEHFPLLHKLLTCYQCIGFWCGVFFGLPYYYSLGLWNIFFIFLYGGVGSFFSVLFAYILNLLDKKSQ